MEARWRASEARQRASEAGTETPEKMLYEWRWVQEQAQEKVGRELQP